MTANDLTRSRSNNRRDATILIIVVAVMTSVLALSRGTDKPPDPAPEPDAAAHGDMNQAMAGMTDFPTEYEPLVLMGNDMMDQGAYAMAAESYRRALKLHDAADVRTDYGACLHSMGLPHRAIEEFQLVLADHPGHGIAAFNIGVVYYNDNALDSARTYFERYLSIEPDGRAAEPARRFLGELGP